MPLLKTLLSNLPSPYPLLLTTTLTTSTALLLSFLYLCRHPSTLRHLTLLFCRKILRHTIPISVNYYFTRKCNVSCKFCFHTETTSHTEPLPRAKEALSLLTTAGMRKLNFAGGEPFLYQKYPGELCQFAKQQLKLESVSIASNGTKVTEKWIKEWGRYIDILAISCDSFIPETNARIGRMDRGTGTLFDNVKKLREIRGWCEKYGIKFKLNTVVCSVNWQEGMVEQVKELDRFRWKVFQVLVVAGENESEKRLRDARSTAVTDEQFEAFCERHRGGKGFTPEPNSLMRESYLILDEYCRFLDPGYDGRGHSESILDVGVQKALSQIHWDEEAFVQRGGL
ncbi:hypothetical protein BCR34DRAFT_473114 [Clohesyomyces aquaticus]|uniref:Radical SAM core domain-containing protein n=1 Tax=Clohesyomyces aquaticus TaxID=1231657 RepID=A0A1Y2A8K9_9PLEO|nr:hypothetical protein BCR34DRAFT_473114 [Clohesyomyces aquaticus]